MVEGGRAGGESAGRLHDAIARYSVGAPIPEGVRNISLCSIAGRLRWEGIDARGLTVALAKINDARCVPPLPSCEVKAMAKSIGKKPPGNGRGKVSREAYDAATARLLDLAGLVLWYRWTGRTAATDRAVMLALIRIGYGCGRDRLRASTRRIAIKAGLDRKTVGASLRRLRCAGWLRLEKPGARWWQRPDLPARGSVYSLIAPPEEVRHFATSKAISGDPSLGALLGACCRKTSGEIDVWRNRTGLGKSAERVWTALRNGADGRSARRLAKTLGMVARTVDRALIQLDYYGLAIEALDGWHATDRDPAAIGPYLASHGATDRQRQRHEAERDEFERQRQREAHRRMGRRSRLRMVDGVGCRDRQRLRYPIPEADRRAELRAQAERLRRQFPDADRAVA